MTDGTSSAWGDKATEIGHALTERERTGSEVRRSIVKLLSEPEHKDLQNETAVALVRERVSRVRYAAALHAAGWFVPDHLIDDLR